LDDKVNIDANQLTEVRLSADGSRVLLALLGDSGREFVLSLPTNCLNAVHSAVPRQADPSVVHKLDSWSMGPAENGQDLLLTLRTPESVAISFTLKPWQVERMATIATYGNSHRPQPKILH
jgi:hypothetical protein